MTKYHTWQEHYRLAEKLLRDAHLIVDKHKVLTDKDHAFIALVQIHATLATAHVDADQVEQWRIQGEQQMAQLRAAS